MKLSKWKYELMAVGLVIVIIGVVEFYMKSAPQRKADAEFDTLVRFANRQEVEIAIIEQSVKLAEYKRQMAKPQKPTSPVIVKSKVPGPESLPEE